MRTSSPISKDRASVVSSSAHDPSEILDIAEAESILGRLASVFFPDGVALAHSSPAFSGNRQELKSVQQAELPDTEARYRTLVEQIPAVVFMAFLDQGIGEAYVSPQIEAMLGFTQEEWLNDPVRWYERIHPDDKERWSIEAAKMFLTGEPLKSVYKVVARDGHVIWFHCEAKMVRTDDGRPWFIHGVGFDVTELKQAEAALLKAHDELELRVQERTTELARANIELQLEIAERERAEADLRRARDDLERRVRERTRELGRANKDLWNEIAERRRAEDSLRDYSERLKVLSRRLMDVHEIERRYIARELHDEIGQTLTGLKLTLAMCSRPDWKPGSESFVQAQMLVDQLIARARKLSLDLRPGMLDDLGLLPALLWHFEQYTAQTNIKVHFSSSGLDGRLPSEVETAAYRIIQEALTNIARHSGAAEASVQAWSDGQFLTLEVEDKGRGFDPKVVLAARDSSGLEGMRERATLLGGRLSVDSEPGAGARLTAQLRIADDEPGRGSATPVKSRL